MKLGFVSAILAEATLEEVMRFAAAEGFDCVEVMCWPAGKAERRYAGVTHVDVTALDEAGVERIRALVEETGVGISGLGYYPNPLAPDEAEAAVYQAHIRKVIEAARKLGVGVMNTFIGRDSKKSVEENWPRFEKVWPGIIAFAEDNGVKVGIENCPMAFTADEWPGGKNLATTPAIWRRMFERIPSKNFGLNYDPSHMVWQHMDYLEPMREFASRLVHVHAKDVRIDRARLNQVGIMAHPLDFHTPKLPGLGEIEWGKFCSVLMDTGYDGPVCIEVEDRAYEKTRELREKSLRQSGRYLRNFL